MAEPPNPIISQGCVSFTPYRRAIVERNSWVWVYCADYKCGHGVPMALVPWQIRWELENRDDVVALIRSRLTCAVCGRKGATIRISGGDYDGLNVFPVAYLEREMARKALAQIGVTI